MTEHTLTLNYPRPPLSENDRLHWRVRHERVKELRTAAWLWGRSLRLRAQRVEVTLTWVVADGRRRDADNIVPTLKALCDGLVDAQIVPDDTPRYMSKMMPVISLQRGVRPHLVLAVRVLE